ncbi:hypothetical protein [Streptomyces sp. LN699]|uniref:hypothetical protein n=1 Tax=Streptomyces sp. LN699 TaxID=3112981 RepID=UPI00371D122A
MPSIVATGFASPRTIPWGRNMLAWVSDVLGGLALREMRAPPACSAISTWHDPHRA